MVLVQALRLHTKCCCFFLRLLLSTYGQFPSRKPAAAQHAQPTAAHIKRQNQVIVLPPPSVPALLRSRITSSTPGVLICDSKDIFFFRAS